MNLYFSPNLLDSKVTGAPDTAIFDQNQKKAIEEQIEAGLPDSLSRRDRARKNDAFYRMQGDVYISKREAETDRDFANRPKRVTYLTKKAIDTLGRRLYQPGPTRKLTLPEDAIANGETSQEDAAYPVGVGGSGDTVTTFPTLDEPTVEAVSKWLEKAYKAAKINAILDAANRRAILNDVSAIQIAATGNPAKPIKLWVYSAHEFEVFCTPDDPTTPWAVVTIAVSSAGTAQLKRVYTLYTDTHEFVYETKPFNPLLMQAGGVRAIFKSSRKHGYGVLPFAFFHNETPVDHFWCGGIGTALAETESDINDQLSDLGDLIKQFVCPDYFGRNLDPAFRYEKRPGRIQLLKPPASVAAGEAVMGPPEVFHVQPQLNVEEVWTDTDKMTTRLFSNLDVPIKASWDNSQSPTSGLQVIAQDVPYMEYLLNRQLYAKTAESELAVVVLTVAGNHYGEPVLLAAAKQAELEVEFPAPTTLVPTPERNQDMQWKIEWGLMSQIEAIMQQRGVTREQAEKIAAQVAQDRALIEGLQQGNTPPSPLPPTGGDASVVADTTDTTNTPDQPSSPPADSAMNSGVPS